MSDGDGNDAIAESWDGGHGCHSKIVDFSKKKPASSSASSGLLLLSLFFYATVAASGSSAFVRS